MPRFDNGAVYTALQKGDIVLMGDPSVYGEILAENLLVEDITRVNLQALITASELVRGKFYRITNAVGGTLSLVVQAVSSTVTSELAINSANGDEYTYDLTSDTATQGFTAVTVDFAPQATPPDYEEGRLYYDDASKTLTYYDDISGTSTQIAQENHVRARNSTGSQINDGQVVYISGATGSNPNITLAQANTASTSRVIGMVTHNIANNTIGKVTTFGIVNDIDTSAFTDGALLYLSSSVAGGLTTTRPSAPNYAVLVGVCLRAHPTQGKILVNPDQRGLGFGTANQLLGMNAGATEQEYKTLTGTTNQVTVTHGVGGITLSLPQNIHTGATPTFAGLTLSNALTAPNGGTGQSVYAVGDILFASTTTALSRLAGVATGNALISGGVGVAPSWGKIGLTTHVSGTLPIANGGTNNTGTPTNGQLLIGNGTAYTLATLTGTTNQVTVTNGAGTITLSLPQSIATTSNPTFNDLTLNGVATSRGYTLVGNYNTTASVPSYGMYAGSASHPDGLGALIIASRPSGASRPIIFATFNGSTFDERGRFDGNGNLLIGTPTTINSAKLVVTSTTQGFLPPRMTTAQKNAIASPTAGLMVYDTTLNKLCVYTTAWETITSV